MEELAGETRLTPIEGNFSVMTNFPNGYYGIQGFRTAKSFHIGEAGIHFDELLYYQDADAWEPYAYRQKITPYGVVGGGLSALVAGLMAWYRDKTKSKSLQSG